MPTKTSFQVAPVLTQIPSTFQRLTEADVAIYGEPAMIHLNPPTPLNDASRQKLEDWLSWRAAPYPATRHSEYLHKPTVDGEAGPKILLSAVLATPPTIEAYLAEISPDRRYDVRGKKAANRGYTARPIRPQDHASAIFDIIHSSDQRQGRDIAPMFAQRPRDHGFPGYIDYRDPHYDDICTGVFSPAPESGLVAYLLGKRVGDHVQYDEIMGHADHIANDVMYLLHFEFLRQCMTLDSRPRCLNYGSWYSGVNPFSPEGGLNRWKRKVNFKPAYLILACS
jgi:hypothetical protein